MPCGDLAAVRLCLVEGIQCMATAIGGTVGRRERPLQQAMWRCGFLVCVVLGASAQGAPAAQLPMQALEAYGA